MTTQAPTSNSQRSLERENVSSGAAGGAAVGAVIALAAFGPVAGMLPVIGGLAIGAAGGGGIGHFVNTYLKKQKHQRPAASKSRR